MEPSIENTPGNEQNSLKKRGRPKKGASGAQPAQTTPPKKVGRPSTGKARVMCWVDVSLIKNLETEATKRGIKPGALASELLARAINF